MSVLYVVLYWCSRSRSSLQCNEDHNRIGTMEQSVHEGRTKRAILLLVQGQHHDTRSTSTNTRRLIKIWQISHVAKNLMSCGVPLPTKERQQQQHQQRSVERGLCEKSLTNCVATVCWVFQKAALLDGTLTALATLTGAGERSSIHSLHPLSSFAGREREKEQEPEKDGATALSGGLAIALTACNSDLALREASSAVTSATSVPTTEPFSHIQYWLCDSCSEYKKLDKGGRMAHVTTYQAVVQHLRYVGTVVCLLLITLYVWFACFESLNVLVFMYMNDENHKNFMNVDNIFVLFCF